MNKNIRNFLVMLAIAAISLSLGWELGHRDLQIQWENYNPKVFISNKEPAKHLDVDFTTFWQVWDLLSEQYVDKKKLDPQKMVDGAVSGMVRSLEDPYTIYLTPEQNKEFNDDLDGFFEGIGVQLGYKKNKLVIISPIKGTPAEKAGIKAGDWILQIDEKETTEMTSPEAASLIRGEKGTTVKLVLLHEGEKEPFTVSIVRDTIKIDSVEITMREDKIAVIKINRFSDKTNTEWDNAVKQIQDAGSKGIILDLRGNPGGLVDSAVYISSDFLPNGSVVVKEQQANGDVFSTKATDNHRLLNIPTIVLIDEGSASSSEILAGALSDRGIKLVGENSFGKGSVQRVRDLEKNSSLHITMAYWLLPSGKSIDKVGLKPDYEVKLSKEDYENNRDPQLDKALSLLK